MLSTKERHLVRRYYTMASLSRSLPLVCLVMLIEWGVLVFLNDFFIHAGGMNYVGLAAVIGIFLLDMAGLAVCYLVPRYGMDKPAWTAIRQKACKTGKRPTYKDHGDQTIFYQLERIKEYDIESTAMAQEAESVAKAFGIKLTPRGALSLIPCLLCTVVMLAAFLPYYAQQYEANEESQYAAATTYDEVVGALQPACASLLAEDPRDEYQPNGYAVFGYLYDRDFNEDVYVAVDIAADGVIDEISYTLSIDGAEDRTTAIERAKSEYAQMHAAAAAIDAPFKYAGMLSLEALPDEFCEQFLAAAPGERVDYDLPNGLDQSDAGDEGDGGAGAASGNAEADGGPADGNAEASSNSADGGNPNGGENAPISVAYFDAGYGGNTNWIIKVLIG